MLLFGLRGPRRTAPGSPRFYHRRYGGSDGGLGKKNGGPRRASPVAPSGGGPGLEQPPRAHVAWDDVYRGFGDHVSYLGVDGGPVARGYTDVGDPAAALGPEDEVTGRRSAPDRGARTRRACPCGSWIPRPRRSRPR